MTTQTIEEDIRTIEGIGALVAEAPRSHPELEGIGLEGTLKEDDDTKPEETVFGLGRLNREYPIGDVLRKSLERFRGLNAIGLRIMYQEIFRRYPTESEEVNNIIGGLFVESMRRGKWVPYETDWNPSYLDILNDQGRTSPDSLSEFGRYLVRAVDEGLLRLEKYRGTTYALPTAQLAEILLSETTEKVLQDHLSRTREIVLPVYKLKKSA